jgi:hypothetical protein
MKNLSIKMLGVLLVALLSVNVAFAKGANGSVQTDLKHGVQFAYPVSGLNIVNITGYTLSDIYVTGSDFNSAPVIQEYFNLPTNQSLQVDFVNGASGILISVETAGTGETGPQYGIRIYDDNNTLIFDGLKQEASRSHTIFVPDAVSDQLRVELYN